MMAIVTLDLLGQALIVVMIVAEVVVVVVVVVIVVVVAAAAAAVLVRIQRQTTISLQWQSASVFRASLPQPLPSPQERLSRLLHEESWVGKCVDFPLSGGNHPFNILIGSG